MDVYLVVHVHQALNFFTLYILDTVFYYSKFNLNIYQERVFFLNVMLSYNIWDFFSFQITIS